MSSVAWSWSTHVNHPRNLRQWVGHWLRRLATTIDGRITSAWEIETTPRLPVATVAACLNQGTAHVQRCLQDEVRAMAEERVLREYCPWLYADERERSRG